MHQRIRIYDTDNSIKSWNIKEITNSTLLCSFLAIDRELSKAYQRLIYSVDPRN